jgi:hypothetical protein
MLLTPHTFVGITIGMAVPNPYIAVPLSFVMHFAGDAVPHWDFFSNTKKEERLSGWRPLAVMADLVTGVAIGLFFTLYVLWVKQLPSTALNVFLCGIASVLPDALEGPYIYMKKEPKFLRPITTLQRKSQCQASLPWGVLTQFVVIGVCLFLILSSMR